MKFKRILATVTVGAALMGAMVVTGSPASARRARCRLEQWPANVQGDPMNTAGAPAAAYLTHNGNGWALRVTHPGADKIVVTGEIIASGRIYGVARATEARDNVKVTRRGKRINFRLFNYGRIDGINFRTRCSEKIAVRLFLNGAPMPADQVYIGADQHHPASVPFDVVRGT